MLILLCLSSLLLVVSFVSVVIILETKDGWKLPPRLVFVPLAFSASQMLLSVAPCFLRGRMTPEN